VISRKAVICERSFPVEGGAFEHAGHISTEVKALLHGIKAAEEVIRRAAIVTYEAEMNMCAYAEHGNIALLVTPEEITIEATDEGQGIADVELAMKEGFSTATEDICRLGFGAGMGLSNMKTFSDVFQIHSEVGKGTRLKMVIRMKRDEN
jgi:anti-sigma regulatory factor (Ser/Thr protein kinase)